MRTIVDMTVIVFVVSSLLSVGLSLTVAQIVAALRQVKLVACSLLANFVIVPAVAVLLARGMSLSEPQSVGLILLGAAAGAPFLPKLVEAARSDVALSVAMMVLLMVGSLAYLPLVLPHLLPGVSVDSLRIARSLSVTMLLPLGLGLFLNARAKSLATRLRRLTSRLSNLSLVVALGMILATNGQELLELLSARSVLSSILFVAVAFGIVFALGGRVVEAREVLGLGTAARNIPAALLVGGQNFTDPGVAVMVIMVALVSLALLAPLTFLFSRRRLNEQR